MKKPLLSSYLKELVIDNMNEIQPYYSGCGVEDSWPVTIN